MSKTANRKEKIKEKKNRYFRSTGNQSNLPTSELPINSPDNLDEGYLEKTIRYLKKNPGNEGEVEGIVKYLKKKNRFDDAITILRTYLKKYSSEYMTILLGKFYTYRGNKKDLESALNQFNKFLNSQYSIIEKAKVYKEKGFIAVKEENYDEANNYFNQALYLLNSIENTTDRSIKYKIALNRGIIFEYFGEIDNALNNYLLCLELYSDKLKLYEMIGDIYYKTRDYDTAQKYFNDLIDKSKSKEELTPEEIKVIKNVYLKICRILIEKQEFDEAEEIIKQYEAYNQDETFLGQFELGRIYRMKGSFDEAIKTFNMILKRFPDSGYTYLELAKTYEDMGNFDAAINTLISGIEKIEDDEYLEIFLAKLLNQTGKSSEAAEINNRILKKIDPEKFNKNDRWRHVLKHYEDNEEKEKHGVFTLELQQIRQIFDDISSTIDGEQKICGFGTDMYCVPMENCGYSGGMNGDRHQLNYLIIVTWPNTTIVKTMYPDDNLFEKMEVTGQSLGMQTLSEQKESKDKQVATKLLSKGIIEKGVGKNGQ